MGDPRRVYYDHESAYKRILAEGGQGWDDRPSNPYEGDEAGSYEGLEIFLVSPHCPAPQRGKTRALELGCGGGQVAMRVAEFGFDVCGVDYSESAVALARQNAARRGLAIDFQVGDCLDLKNYADGSFQLLLDNHVLHCILPGDREQFLSTAYRVLEAGGIFYSETMSAEGDFRPSSFGADVDLETRCARNRRRYWVLEEELREELEGAGFEILHLQRRPQDPGQGDDLLAIARRGSLENQTDAKA